MASAQCIDELNECAQRIDVSISNIFAQIGTLAEAIDRTWRKTDGKPVSSADLASLRPLIETCLTQRDSCLQGCGVVLQPGVLQDREMYLEWRQLGSGGRAVPLSLNFNRRCENFYDYRDMPWFATPRDSGRSSVVGPYVDLYGQDMYILTFSSPILVDGHFIGMAAADIALNRFERVVTAKLMHLQHEALILSGEGRVVAANTANFIAGEMASAGFAADARCQHAPLAEQSAHWTLVQLPDKRRRAA
ncbi:cache domain-containing protein [Pseudomonas sp. ZM23]|uniref:Cache domain-containing protein n=1 Tax=Pseudomonas triclosanedens TaxID=2961893 RepID=A0ABY7A3M8_9PSED|nr:cache domain-containing protein [Pseudomonas triclosanedens]MCP8464942.1 cache domain-containing protein [Pseudomonas triclosanedens]MCP8470346.1 cache domain-containing protein [Pseudomonas triclosanedens]MCP8476151.1 cache domain-containing protein [Pseudomonas triclosanedens]WAI51616.1 cache domain-containing protein [Pseudomonas triclosanedens]